MLHYFDGFQRSSLVSVGSAVSLENYNSGFAGMPYLQLAVSPHQVAEELSKRENYPQDMIDAIADRFFPVPDSGLWDT